MHIKMFECDLDNFELEADFSNKGIRVFQIFPRTPLYEREKVYRGILYMKKNSQIVFQRQDLIDFYREVENHKLELYSYMITVSKEAVDYLESLLIMNTLVGDNDETVT